MTGVSDATLWATIITLGIGTFLIRFSFLGLVGARQLPPKMMRLLRYVPVTVIPALVTPMVVWPRATGGETDPVRLIAAMVALAVGAVTRNSLAAIITGLATLWTLPALLG
jgi:branched-subunit amino acid transport protein